MPATALAAKAAPAKLVFSGTTHNTAGRDGAAVSQDGFLDLNLTQPHPAAENLFGAALSACFIGALQLAAQQQKVRLPALPEIDATIDLLNDQGGYFLRAHLDVALPGLDRATAQALVDEAHAICPYSKATRGNIDVLITLR